MSYNMYTKMLFRALLISVCVSCYKAAPSKPNGNLQFYWDEASSMCLAIKSIIPKGIEHRFNDFQKCINANLKKSVVITYRMGCRKGHVQSMVPTVSGKAPIFTKECNHIDISGERYCARFRESFYYFCEKGNIEKQESLIIQFKDIYSPETIPSLNKCSNRNSVKFYYLEDEPGYLPGCRAYRENCENHDIHKTYKSAFECVTDNSERTRAKGPTHQLRCPEGYTPLGIETPNNKFFGFPFLAPLLSEADPCPPHDSISMELDSTFGNYCCIPATVNEPAVRQHYWVV